MKRIKSLVKLISLVLCILLLLSGCGKASPHFRINNATHMVSGYLLDDSFIYSSFDNSPASSDSPGLPLLEYEWFRYYFETGKLVSLPSLGRDILWSSHAAIIGNSLYYPCGDYLCALNLATNEITQVVSPFTENTSFLCTIDQRLWSLSFLRTYIDGQGNVAHTLQAEVYDPATGQLEECYQFSKEGTALSRYNRPLAESNGYFYTVGVTQDGTAQLFKLNRQLELEAEIDLSAMEEEVTAIGKCQLVGANMVLCESVESGLIADRIVLGYIDGDQVIPIHEGRELQSLHDNYGGYPVYHENTGENCDNLTFYTYNETTRMLDKTIIQPDGGESLYWKTVAVSDDQILVILYELTEDTVEGKYIRYNYHCYLTDRNFTGLSSLPPES